LPSRFFSHSSSCGQTLNSHRRLPIMPCRVAAVVADGAEWVGGEQRRVGHTHGKARSGAGREGEVSSWLCFSPVKTTCTKDSLNQRLLRAMPTNPQQYQRARGRSWMKASTPIERRLFAPPAPSTLPATL
jgi:hypothetical protein